MMEVPLAPRSPLGARHGKLSDRALSIIRSGTLSRQACAERFGISVMYVDRLRRLDGGGSSS